MATRKIIYWHADQVRSDGRMFANVHILVGYNQGYITDFQKMARILRKTFPQAKNSQVVGGKVSESSTVKGHTIIVWSGYIPKVAYAGWEEKKNTEMEYCY